MIVILLCPKCWDRQTWANSVDPNQTPHNGVCSGSTLFAAQPAILDISSGSKIDVRSLEQVW